jgi:hypothetical protein
MVIRADLEERKLNWILYAPAGSFAEYGIKTRPKAFKRICQRWYKDVARQGFTQCDDPALQSVASASNENRAKESTHWQKGFNVCSSPSGNNAVVSELEDARGRVVDLLRRPAPHPFTGRHCAIGDFDDSVA